MPKSKNDKKTLANPVLKDQAAKDLKNINKKIAEIKELLPATSDSVALTMLYNELLQMVVSIEKTVNSHGGVGYEL